MSENHPHNNAINNMENISPLIDIIANSKTAYLKKNLSIHLHEREISLFKDVVKHDKPHHKALRINKYKKLMENPDSIPKHFELHQKIYLKRYKKLEAKSIITVDENPDNGLAYDTIVTDKGREIFKEIKTLEKEWEDDVLKDVENKDELLTLLKNVSNNAIQFSYKAKKEQKGVY